MKVHELKAEMDRHFEAVDGRFEAVDRRFEVVDARFEAVERRLARLDAKIEAEGDRTRRHFDVVAEQLKAEMRSMVGTLADVQARTQARVAELDSKGTTLYADLDDHELRVRVLERKGPAQH